MCVDCYADKKRKGHTGGFTFPLISAELSDDIVKEYKMGPALRRLGDALVLQMQRQRGGRIAGVCIKSVEFCMLLDKEEKSDDDQGT